MWILVTGGAKRLGASLCLALSKKGYSVVIQYKNSQKEAEEVAERCRVVGKVEAKTIYGDFDTPSSAFDFTKRYLSEFPETMALINNVGEYHLQSILGATFEEWSHLYQVNLHTPFILVQALLPSFIKHKGQVINIGVSGLNRPGPSINSNVYRLTKKSLLDFTLTLARELASKNVRVNMVSPGQLINSVDLPVDMDKLPMRRPALCEEICRVVTFLLDSESAYITGQNIEIAGGLGLC